jgi:hypothetical protein
MRSLQGKWENIALAAWGRVAKGEAYHAHLICFTYNIECDSNLSIFVSYFSYNVASHYKLVVNYFYTHA